MISVYTIGHSTHLLEDFLAILHTHSISALVDVRLLPGSNRYPHFNKENLEKSLAKDNIAYHHLLSLAGRRKANSDSVNSGWRNKSFKGYADYMQTKEFTDGLEILINIAKEKHTAIMCAEAVPWRCHRSLIGDALIVRQIEVHDIYSKTSIKPHVLTSFAKVDGLQITYPPDK